MLRDTLLLLFVESIIYEKNALNKAKILDPSIDSFEKLTIISSFK